MSNFSISFSYPWLLLLLLPAIALTLIPYFRLSKKFRRTRNRLVSIVTHICAMVLCICVLSGIQFRYVKKNTDNEILLLVDVSDTSNRAEERRNDFVKNVLADGRYDGYKIGVVTFGFTQNYAVPLTYEVDEIYNLYKEAEVPDTSATNIEGALKYAQTLFAHPESSKIVLITDGKETDGSAFSAIRSLTAQGTIVDAAYISEDFNADSDVQATGIKLPETHVKPNEDCTITVKLRSRSATENTRVILKDNGEVVKTVDSEGVEMNEKIANLAVGENEVLFTHKFPSPGLHEISVQVIDRDDEFEQNNEYTTYIYLQKFNKVLIVEQKSAESDALAGILDEEKYAVDRLDLSAADVLTTKNGISIASVTDLRRYDQVIMNNIADSDLMRFDGFTDILYSYVYDYGGGLLTLGGDDSAGKAHAYSHDSEKISKYQELLPVQAIDYTPPVGLVVCIDRSGSMGDGKLKEARQGLISCYHALNERDYIGIVTLDGTYDTILPLTSKTHDNEITTALTDDRLETAKDSTNFFSAISRAGEMLQSNQQVEKKHIIIVSDGDYNGPSDPPIEEVKKLARRGISISVILVGSSLSDIKMEKLKELVSYGQKAGLGGQIVANASGSSLIDLMRDDLLATQVAESVNEPFAPIVKSPTSAIFNGVEYGINQDSGTGDEGGKDDEEEKDERDAFRMRVTIGGFYGVKKKEGATTLLTGNYDVTPLYSQWKFGDGTVGSFMSDLTGLAKADGSKSWSKDFMEDENGRKLILNIIDNLMPTEDISPAAYEYQLTERNYTNTLRVYAKLGNEEYLDAKLVFTSDGTEISLNEASENEDFYVTEPFGKANLYSRCEFIAKKPGVYKIVLTKRNADGEAIEFQTVEIFKSFAFSEEYNLYPEDEDREAFLIRLAENGNGKKIEDITDPKEIFESFVTGIDKNFDPRYLFAVISIVLFLTDIAVRKFKFKWPHEIIMERRSEKESKKQRTA